MNTTKYEKMADWFEARIAETAQQIQDLRADNREDEAVFAKVRMNIWEIFKTVLSAAETATGHDAQKTAKFFLKKLDQIPDSWRASLNAAEANGNMEKAHIERIKLDAAAEIRTAFLKIGEVEA